jgi:hypothetical protein
MWYSNEDASQLRKELKSFVWQLQGQVQENETLSHLNRQQEEKLLVQEEDGDSKEDMRS